MWSFAQRLVNNKEKKRVYFRFFLKKSFSRKSGNLLVDDNWRIAVVDFGISRMIDLSMSKKNIGTAIYSAPEVLCGKPYSFSADVFSFSFVIWELLSRQVPYKVARTKKKKKRWKSFYKTKIESQASVHHQWSMQR